LWEIDDNDLEKVSKCVWKIAYLKQQFEKGEWEEVLSFVKRSIPQYEVKLFLSEILNGELDKLKKETVSIEAFLYLLNNI
jgi:hypothetical protein